MNKQLKPIKKFCWQLYNDQTLLKLCKNLDEQIYHQFCLSQFWFQLSGQIFWKLHNQLWGQQRVKLLGQLEKELTQ